jgi:hypothetical protein
MDTADLICGKNERYWKGKTETAKSVKTLEVMTTAFHPQGYFWRPQSHLDAVMHIKI